MVSDNIDVEIEKKNKIDRLLVQLCCHLSAYIDFPMNQKTQMMKLRISLIKT